MEECNGVFTAYEMKWNTKHKGGVSLPKAFAEAYNVNKIQVVTPDNYLDIMYHK